MDMNQPPRPQSNVSCVAINRESWIGCVGSFGLAVLDLKDYRDLTSGPELEKWLLKIKVCRITASCPIRAACQSDSAILIGLHYPVDFAGMNLHHGYERAARIKASVVGSIL